MKRIFLASFLVWGMFFSLKAFSLEVLIIGGAASNSDNFKPFFEQLTPDVRVQYRNVDVSPLTADHRKELRATLEVLDATEDPMLLIGYSLGGKIAYKAALERPEQVIGLFLMDPIDGAPPFTSPSRRFPIWVDPVAQPLLESIPVEILFSDKAYATGFLGVPCVPQKAGPETFKDAIPWANVHRFSDFSHIDFLYPPISITAQISCRKGSSDAADKGRAQALALWNDFQKRFL